MTRTVLIFQATLFVRMITPTFKVGYLRLLHALDAFAEAQMRNAVPAPRRHRTRGDIHRQPLMQAGTVRQRQARSTRTGSLHM